MFRHDHARSQRVGIPEAILCQGKSLEEIASIVRGLRGPEHGSVLLTRLEAEVCASLSQDVRALLDYDPRSRTALLNAPPAMRVLGRVAIISAGTADGAVVGEAARTLVHLGIDHSRIADVGVAGLWRLLERIDDINCFDVAIVVAGMDAALASVLGGLTPLPLVAVPTSTGYGASEQGRTALNGMLASCAPGIMVVNIDNGYGAACVAYRILAAIRRRADAHE